MKLVIEDAVLGLPAEEEFSHVRILNEDNTEEIKAILHIDKDFLLVNNVEDSMIDGPKNPDYKEYFSY